MTRRLQIARAAAHYRVARDHPTPEKLRSTLDEVMEKSLAFALSSELDRRLRPGTEGLWLIRELRAGIHLNAAWDRRRLASVWASRVAESLDRVLADGPGDGVLWFPDRPAYLARFVLDVALGQAWGRWYYQPFEGLRLLPSSAAIRTALCEKAEDGNGALSFLETADVRILVDALTEQDARRILRELTGGEQTAPASAFLEAAWNVRHDWIRDGNTRPAGQREALRTYVECLKRYPSLSPSGFPTAARAILALEELMLESPGRADHIVRSLVGRNLAALYRAAGTEMAERLLPLSACSETWLSSVCEALAGRAAPSRSAEETELETRHSRFGCAFLLLPQAAEVPLEELCKSWPAHDDVEIANLLRFLVIVKCCGRDQSREAFWDPVLRDLFAIPPQVTPASLENWQRSVQPRLVEQLLRDVAEWCERRGDAEASPLIAARIPGIRGQVILLDSQRGFWLDLVPARSVARSLNRLPLHDSPILCSAELLATLNSAGFEAIDLTTEAESHQYGPAFPEIVARIPQAGADLEYLRSDKSLRLNRSLDRVLTVLAQGLLRSFAWRLPGFALSSLPHLHRNFLDVRAAIEQIPDSVTVRLSRAPLGMILQMTGIDRCSYRVPWLPDVEIALYPETWE